MNRIFIFLLCIFSCNQNNKITLQGLEFGTSYSVQYFSENQINFSNEIDSIFGLINSSMSTYIDNSIISRVNNDESIELDNHFINVFNTSKKIFNKTNGKFDPSVGVLVNFWGFGPKYVKKPIDSLEFVNLKKLVGFDMFGIDNSNHIIRPKNSFLDFNAIAKGYAVDLISVFLENNDIKNYLVEIGGEIRVKGVNLSKNNPWVVGIDAPNYDITREIFNTTELKNSAMATSGIYRKYKVDSNGKRYAHILDPISGAPTKTNILSVSVISDNCIEADAYATALHVMSLTEIGIFLKINTDLDVYIIYENEKNEIVGKAYNNFTTSYKPG
ncbi:MAG: FAD:protein FMN transferase [Bacteroidota bacterium]|nr:FAD:protein FMN transferase [Bacteroidota bacterium]